MASVNLQTGKIHGCKKGTKTYYHEEAHLKYDSNALGRAIRTIQDFSLESLIMFTAMGFLFPHWIIKVIILALLIMRILSQLKEEVDCWIYAKNKIGDTDDRRCKREV